MKNFSPLGLKLRQEFAVTEVHTHMLKNLKHIDFSNPPPLALLAHGDKVTFEKILSLGFMIFRPIQVCLIKFTNQSVVQ